jgi:hypothetical protein
MAIPKEIPLASSKLIKHQLQGVEAWANELPVPRFVLDDIYHDALFKFSQVTRRFTRALESAPIAWDILKSRLRPVRQRLNSKSDYTDAYNTLDDMELIPDMDIDRARTIRFHHYHVLTSKVDLGRYCLEQAEHEYEKKACSHFIKMAQELETIGKATDFTGSFVLLSLARGLSESDKADCYVNPSYAVDFNTNTDTFLFGGSVRLLEVEREVKRAVESLVQILQGLPPSTSLERDSSFRTAAEDRYGAAPSKNFDVAATAKHSEDFRWVLWNGVEYDFSITQALCVQVLWKAWKDGISEVTWDTLARESKATSDKFGDVFRKNKKRHPAYGPMIIKGRRAGTFRLNTLENDQRSNNHRQAETTPITNRDRRGDETITDSCAQSATFDTIRG